MTRALVLAIAIGLNVVAMPALAAPCAGFTDVEDTSPFCANVAWIKNRNITLGCSSATLYCPDNAVSRLALAAFLNRLGDVLLPPNVVWVAPVGGQFQSIQAAIDAAAVNASAGSRYLVKIAPGEFNEAIVMAPFVDLEGAGPTATTITSEACEGASPFLNATVNMSSSSQLRAVTIRNHGANGIHCAGVYVPPSITPPDIGPLIRNAVIDVATPPGPEVPIASGIRVAGSTLTTAALFQDVRISVTGGNPSNGVLFAGLSPGSGVNDAVLRDVDLVVLGPNGSFGINANTTKLQAERVSVTAPSLTNNYVLKATGGGRIRMRESSLLAISVGLQTDAASYISLANTEISGLQPPWNNVACLNVYQRETLTPVVCN